jgi:hypothetical protein
MAYTPVFSQGVKFIKIARIDDQGKDNTLSLQELNSIRIDYSDTGIIEYPITSISKYDTYFLFGVLPTNTTSSTDNQILNYRFSASFYTGDTLIPGGSSYYIPEDTGGSYTVSYNNPLNYFTASTGQYTLGNLPNIPITFIVSASITGSGGGSGNSILYLNSSLRGNINSGSAFFNPSGGGTLGNINFTSTLTPTINEEFSLIYSPSVTSDLTIKFFATQSVAPTASVSDLVVLQPYLDEDFYVSEYNVLAGNAVIPRYSELYMDVDYSTNIVQAVNQVQIISGSATRAAVQDSNYTTFANTSPRYIGKELSSAAINVWTEGDISYGKVPNVSNPEVNFVSFKSLNGTSPQWGNNNVDLTQVNIEYIIDSNNNLTKPINDTDNINLNTIRQTFPESTPSINNRTHNQSNASLFLNNVEVSGSDLSTLNGQWPLFKSGYRIEPILYTQTASYDVSGNVTGFGYTTTMSFVQGEQGPNVTKNDYMMYAAGTEDIITPSQPLSVGMALPAGLHFTSVNIGSSGSLRDNIFIAYSGSIYNPTGSLTNLKTEGYILDFRVKLVSNTITAVTVTYALQKSINGGSSWSDLATTQVNYAFTPQNVKDLGVSRDANIFYQERNATTSSLYRVAVTSTEVFKYDSPPQAIPTQSPVYLNNNSYFWITQYPAPNTGLAKAPFWTTGSSANILLASTASEGLNIYRNQKQKDIANSGFKPINLDFEPQIYDEIRFEGLEQLSFIITTVTESANNQMILNLDQEIPNGVNLDRFLLRRYVDDPSSILLNVNYPLQDKSGSSSSTGNGILKPQYVTKEVDTIIQNILTQNLI